MYFLKNKMLVGIVYKVFFASLTFLAIFNQLSYNISNDLSVLNFFSFFTIQSNIFASTMLIISAVFLYKQKNSKNLNFFRGASTLYMTLTGLIYFLLLRNVDVQTTQEWVNIVLHYVMPLVLILDWYLVQPVKKVVTYKKALKWTIFPITYVIYSLIRGSITDWYPYPFLNASKNGYTGVFVTSIAIFILSLGIIYLLTIKKPEHINN